MSGNNLYFLVQVSVLVEIWIVFIFEPAPSDPSTLHKLIYIFFLFMFELAPTMIQAQAQAASLQFSLSAIMP